jgi:hypothetical protein
MNDVLCIYMTFFCSIHKVNEGNLNIKDIPRGKQILVFQTQLHKG